MAKELTFVCQGESFSGLPVKLEREKIYGKSEIVATDSKGNRCVSANLDPDGTLIIPAGAIKPATVDDEGYWIEKNSLIPMDENGKKIEAVPSSFETGIRLDQKVSMETFLDHIWKAVYQIINPELAAKIGNDIFGFPFSYRGGVSCDDGFLMAANGIVYLFSGEPVEFPLIGIAEEGVLDEPEADGDEAEPDDLDFDMM